MVPAMTAAMSQVMQRLNQKLLMVSLP